jgi:histidyl-tRNA synthetase
MDKAGKREPVEFARRWDAAFGENWRRPPAAELMASKDLGEIEARAGKLGGRTAPLDEAMAETRRLMTILDNFGITEFCKLDLRVVRGLAYYTGPVFEFYDRSEKERAICGGGRYDDLLGKLGKSKEPAVGFGMGDVVLSILLQEKGLLRTAQQARTVFVIDVTAEQRTFLLQLVGELRRKGIRADFSYVWQDVPKQMKLAAKRQAEKILIIRNESELGEPNNLEILEKGRTTPRFDSLKKLRADPISVLGL